MGGPSPAGDEMFRSSRFPVPDALSITNAGVVYHEQGRRVCNVVAHLPRGHDADLHIDVECSQSASNRCNENVWQPMTQEIEIAWFSVAGLVNTSKMES